jgi:hypothetical protein
MSIEIVNSAFKDEADLAAVVCQWLEFMGWDVYKEVPLGGGGSECDIVALKEGVVWAIECKMRAGEAVCLQAHKRLPYAHHVSIAVPEAKRNCIVDYFLRGHGIGLLSVYPHVISRLEWRKGKEQSGYMFRVEANEEDIFKGVCKERIEPRIWRKHKDPKRLISGIRQTKKFLTVEWKKPVAGLPCGGQMTPFKVTLNRVNEFLKRHGYSTIEEIAEKVDHYYYSKKAAKAGIYNAMSRAREFQGNYERIVENGKTKWRMKENVDEETYLLRPVWFKA